MSDHLKNIVKEVRNQLIKEPQISCLEHKKRTGEEDGDVDVKRILDLCWVCNLVLFVSKASSKDNKNSNAKQDAEWGHFIWNVCEEVILMTIKTQRIVPWLIHLFFLQMFHLQIARDMVCKNRRMVSIYLLSCYCSFKSFKRSVWDPKKNICHWNMSVLKDIERDIKQVGEAERNDIMGMMDDNTKEQKNNQLNNFYILINTLITFTTKRMLSYSCLDQI